MFKVMFYSPRIAPNTGNAIRMVAATGCELHLVEPLGFDLSEPKLRRAGLDYHDLASVTVHPDLASAWAVLAPARVFAFTAHATTSFADIAYQPGDVLMFGPEPTGLDPATLSDPHITVAGEDPDAERQAVAELVQRRRRRRLRSVATAGILGRGVTSNQVSQWVSCSAGSLLAGRKSVPLV